MKKVKTYLAGPIGVVPRKDAIPWRDMVTDKLKEKGIEALNPMGQRGGDRLGKHREKLKMWMDTGEISKVRHFVSNTVIPPDLEMVEEATFLTLYVPVDDGYEICGTFGEATLAFFLKKKPLYIVTDRSLKPIKLPAWLVGCSTKIFGTWAEYFDFIDDVYGED